MELPDVIVAALVACAILTMVGLGLAAASTILTVKHHLLDEALQLGRRSFATRNAQLTRQMMTFGVIAVSTMVATGLIVARIRQELRLDYWSQDETLLDLLFALACLSICVFIAASVRVLVIRAKKGALKAAEAATTK